MQLRISVQDYAANLVETMHISWLCSKHGTNRPAYGWRAREVLSVAPQALGAAVAAMFPFKASNLSENYNLSMEVKSEE